MLKPTYTALCVLMLLVATELAAAAQPLDSGTDVIDRLRENAQSIEDLDAVIRVETYKDGDVNLTQRLRLSILQPDRMRQEYLEPDYLAGNMTLITSDQMWIYISAADTWFEKDLSELSAAEQPWLVFRQFLRGVKDEFDAYDFELTNDEVEAYHLVGTPTADDAAYGRVGLWVDQETFVPTRRMLYDVDGNLLVDLHILEVEQVLEGTYLARTMETYDEDGALASVIRYEEITVNSGLDSSLFERSGASDDT